MKQVIVVRRDLKMRRGKEISQGAHASLKATLDYIDHPYVKEWLADIFTKIGVYVDSEKELLELYDRVSNDSDIPCSLIRDNGQTEFKGVDTYTAVAVGPAPRNMIDEFTGHLKLR